MLKISGIGKDITTRRVVWKGRYRVFVFKKGRRGIVTHQAWKRDRQLWEPKVREKVAKLDMVYRSSMVLAYSGDRGIVDYRVWIYTETPDISLNDLEIWMTKLGITFNTRAKLDEDITGRELNEKIPRAEMESEGASAGQWRGFAEFEKGASTVKYYALQSGSEFIETLPFTTMKK